jgi:hypothetical protein
VEATDGVGDYNWQIGVTSVPPHDSEAAAWLEQYLRAMESDDHTRLQELGYLASPTVAEQWRRERKPRQKYQVQLSDLQGSVQGDELRLSFSRVERWYDPKSFSSVVNHEPERLRLVRMDCERIVGRPE